MTILQFIRKQYIDFKQYMCLHSFTTLFEQRGNKPDVKVVAEVGIWKAWVFDNAMYCKKCGYKPLITAEFLKRCEEIDKLNKTDEEKLTQAFVEAITRKPTI